MAERWAHSSVALRSRLKPSQAGRHHGEARTVAIVLTLLQRVLRLCPFVSVGC